MGGIGCVCRCGYRGYGIVGEGVIECGDEAAVVGC